MKFKNPLVLFCLLCIGFVLTIPQVFAQKLDYRLGEFLVKLDPKTSISDFERLTLRPRSKTTPIKIAEVLNEDWKIIKIQFDHTHWNEFKVLKEIKSWPGVLVAQRNHLIDYRRKPNDTYYERQWWHFNDGTYGVAGADFKTELAWDLSTGGLTEQGDTIVLCVIDDGLDIQHYDIRPNLWKNYAEIPGNSMDDDQNGYVDDFNGWNTFNKTDVFASGRHGTPVCGIAMARGSNNLGICGMSWNVKLMFVSGGGDEAAALLAYSYPWQARKLYNETNGKKGAFVVATNSSWGADYRKPEEAPLWCSVYDSLGAVGILNAASTTNLDLNVDIAGDLPTTCESEWLITVTNMESNDEKDPTAGYGAKSIDIGAYGENVFTLAPGNSLDYFKGTSAASPQISGAIALLYSMPCNAIALLAKTNPAAAALQMKQLILQNVRPIPSLQGITTSGGVLDFEKIIGALLPVKVNIEIKQVEFVPALKTSNYPITIEFRKSNHPVWSLQVLINEFSTAVFDDLEDCVEYEYRVKGGCALLGNIFSPIQKLTTSGCCVAPDRLSIKTLENNRVQVNIKNPDNKVRLAYLVKEQNAINWDTSYISDFQDSEIWITGLLPCRKYETVFYYFCGGEISNISEPFEFTTVGCESCTDANYCNRGRPQSSFEWIEAISLNGVLFQSSNDLGYGVHLGKTPQWFIQKSISQNILIQPGFATDTNPTYFAAWLDWDGNGIFENQENLIPNATVGSGTKNFSFIVPSDAINGITRLRVMVKYAVSTNEPPEACGQGLEFGEYEDYCVYLEEEVCENLSDVFISGKTSSTAWFGFVKNEADDLIHYQYRPIHSPLWESDQIRASDLVLMDLDSCTKYEIRFNRICNKRYLPYKSLAFITEGSPCETTSVNPDLQKKMNVFPNPFDEYFTIGFEGNAEIPIIQIFDASGQLLSFRMVRIGAHHCRIFPEPGLSGMLWIRTVSKDSAPQTHRMIRMK